MMVVAESDQLPTLRPQIAHIIYRLGIGGLENGLVNLVNAMPSEHFRHTIICLAGYTGFARRIDGDDVALFDLKKQPGKDPACYARLYKLLRQLRPDIVHTRNLAALDYQFVAAAAGVRYRIHGEHGWDVGDISGSHRKRVLIRKLSRAVVHRYSTVSQHMQHWLESVIGIPAGKISQIYNGIDVDKFRPRDPATDDDRVTGTQDSDRFVIGCVGRLDPIKDHSTLLHAVHALVSNSAVDSGNVRLRIVGDGEMREQLQALCAKLQIENVVTFVGASDSVAEELRGMDVFVLPSLNEGISNTILEAMATGLPVIASAAGGNPELVVDDATGRLFTPQSKTELTVALDFYRRNRDVGSRHGQAGRQRVMDNFSMKSMVRNYLDLYQHHAADGRKLDTRRP